MKEIFLNTVMPAVFISLLIIFGVMYIVSIFAIIFYAIGVHVVVSVPIFLLMVSIVSILVHRSNKRRVESYEETRRELQSLRDRYYDKS